MFSSSSKMSSSKILKPGQASCRPKDETPIGAQSAKSNMLAVGAYSRRKLISKDLRY